MKKTHQLIAVVFLSMFLPLSANASENGIRVTGTSKVSVVPDMARFTLAINEQGDNLVSIKSSVDAKTAKVVGLCKKLGVETKDITSSEVSIHPQYNYQTKKFLGYEVSREIKVTLKDLKNYTALVNGAIESGITTIRNIILDTSKRDELGLKALAAASNSAKTKAMILAKSNGVTLGDVISIDESGVPSERRIYAFKERAVASPNSGAFEPGEISVSATVVVQYSIK